VFYSFFFSRCNVLESIGAEKEQLKAFLTMLRGVQPEDEEKKNEWVELAEKIARMYFASGHLHSARRALSNALVTCADNFKMEHFNLLLELQISTKHYLDVIKVRQTLSTVTYYLIHLNNELNLIALTDS
jgi:general transcription factor 3C polypeptide 3 (transcription factor C subunit 4)